MKGFGAARKSYGYDILHTHYFAVFGALVFECSFILIHYNKLRLRSDKLRLIGNCLRDLICDECAQNVVSYIACGCALCGGMARFRGIITKHASPCASLNRTTESIEGFSNM